ncbi:hypothetical protein CDD82_3402 [Ophiocordyceps australis]|uniref:Major facilitator superfamily (MFS) profile domain-containing protein n=1 Tax=Ophiocordyceps australis TaxID=1399860 RepID=A0A2C5ZCY2_9HYPO|nr:hypothetical protein CDD82_3402 [Ophiocordyceps australis]
MAAPAKNIPGPKQQVVLYSDNCEAQQEHTVDQPGMDPEAGGGPNETSPLIRNISCETWKDPRRNLYRLATCFWSFLLMGANDASYGALIPYLEKYYHVSHGSVSFVFLSPTIGYIASAISNHYLHIKLGQRGVAVIAGACHAAAYSIMSSHPPFRILVLSYVLVGFGNGVVDCGWNAWVSSLDSASQLLGLLHACYGAGGVIGPLLATALITKAKLEWYTFCYIMVGLAGIESVVMSWAFWDLTASKYRHGHGPDAKEPKAGLYATLFEKPAAQVCWTAASFLFILVGMEVALGGWIVTFMLDERHTDKFASGMVSVVFWLGMTMGRAILGFLTPALGAQYSTMVYMVFAMAALVVFWMVPVFYVSVIAVASMGLFIGPLFPNVILMVNMLLPRQMHVTAIGFASAIGGSGAAVMPFVTGILAQYANGVKVLPPVILALQGVTFVLWNCFPAMNKARQG